MWLLIVLHVLVGGTLIVASAVAIQVLAARPYWVGGMVGLLIYLLTLALFGATEHGDRD